MCTLIFYWVFRKIYEIPSKMICDMTFRNFTVLQLNCMTIILEDLIMDVIQDINFDTFLVHVEFYKLLIWVSYCRFLWTERFRWLYQEKKEQVELCIILHGTQRMHLPDPLVSNGKNCEIDLQSISSSHSFKFKQWRSWMQAREDLLCWPENLRCVWSVNNNIIS